MFRFGDRICNLLTPEALGQPIAQCSLAGLQIFFVEKNDSFVVPKKVLFTYNLQKCFIEDCQPFCHCVVLYWKVNGQKVCVVRVTAFSFFLHDMWQLKIERNLYWRFSLQLIFSMSILGLCPSSVDLNVDFVEFADYLEEAAFESCQIKRWVVIEISKRFVPV